MASFISESNDEFPQLSASLFDLNNQDDGKREYKIPKNKNFTIGRKVSSSMVVENVYLSPIHCVINYENGQFKIYDNDSIIGTYVNFGKIPSVKDNLTSKILNHGDLIGFGNSVSYQMYIFIITSSVKELGQQYDDFVGKIIKHKDAIKEKYSNQVYVLNGLIKLSDSFKEHLNRCSQTAKEFEAYKNVLRNVVKNELECPICQNEMTESCVTNCSHTFCVSCINKWLLKNKECPLCRNQVNSINSCLALNKIVKSICYLLGNNL